MSRARGPSLSELGLEVRAARTPRALRARAAQLRDDPRTGCRLLAERCERKLEEIAKERRRLRGLFALRRRLHAEGLRVVAGVDEVGMGPLAGPIVAAAVVLPDRVELLGLDDSKKLTASARERLDAEIRASAVHVGVAEVWPEEIERLNVYHAGLAAMRRAVEDLGAVPDHLLVDARTVPGVDASQTPIVGGDALDGSIAAASVVAKVHRDAIMQRMDAEYPGYGFARHKGYGTAGHLRALRERGPTPIHRRSFAPVSQLSSP